MRDGEITGIDYATRKPVCLRWQAGRISEASAAPKAPVDAWWIAPPLVDLQVNGYAGVDFQRDDLNAADLLKAVRGLRAAGCTRILLTLITDEWPKLVARVRRYRELRAQSGELQNAIIGWHIEGPFLSAEPGFRGAHNPDVMCDPTPAHIEELRAVTGSDPVLITVASERTGSLAAIRQAVSAGFKVSLGHTNAPLDNLREAVKAGASAFTHLGNGCPKDLDRHDNIFLRVFDTPGLTVGLIVDRIHISPMFLRLAHRVLPEERIYYTTDAMSAAGAPPGRYTIGRLELEVGADQVVRLPGKPNFAGSALRPIDGILRAAQMLNRPWHELWKHFAEIPAKYIGLRNDLGIGQPANFCLLRVNQPEEKAELKVYLDGAEVS
ncbi:MAG: N-acetylglucosamine-6-phosphate deacetylase [Verrucomicrobiota bacterium]